VTRLNLRARGFVVGGWGVIVLGSLGYLAMLVHLGYFGGHQSLGAEGQILLPVLSNAAAFVGWRWLTRLQVIDDETGLVRRAFYALGLQALFTAAWVLCGVAVSSSASTSDQLIIATLVLEAVGGLAVFVGFVALTWLKRRHAGLLAGDRSGAAGANALSGV